MEELRCIYFVQSSHGPFLAGTWISWQMDGGKGGSIAVIEMRDPTDPSTLTRGWGKSVTPWIHSGWSSGALRLHDATGAVRGGSMDQLHGCYDYTDAELRAG